MPPSNPTGSNPLFNTPSQKDQPASNSNTQNTEGDEAVELIRGKIKTLYGQEPDVKEEVAEAEAARPRSKHQQFMYNLSTSGKPLAEIQQAWHDYYQSLPDPEKHEVWREFYAAHGRTSSVAQPQVHHVHHVPHHQAPHPQHHSDVKPDTFNPLATAKEVKDDILSKISDRVHPKHKRRLKSLGFGLAMGFMTLVILMFGFFNERFIAPFITPSRAVTSTPIISDATAAVGSDPKVIIPKINVEIPVVYDQESTDEKVLQRALEEGVVHYPTTSDPGQQGNAAIFGHSSNNILNKGKYKFAFVLLSRLENGDTFMLEKEGKRYIYKVFEKKVVKPEDVSVLNDRDRPTATLITCDPPGTSINRLVVVGEQISPDPTQNVASTKQTASTNPHILPANAPTLWSRFWAWISS